MLVLNLRNRIIFKAADEEGALESADFLGKRTVVKRSWGYSAAGTRNRQLCRNRGTQNQTASASHLAQA